MPPPHTLSYCPPYESCKAIKAFEVNIVEYILTCKLWRHRTGLRRPRFTALCGYVTVYYPFDKKLLFHPSNVRHQNEFCTGNSQRAARINMAVLFRLCLHCWLYSLHWTVLLSLSFNIFFFFFCGNFLFLVSFFFIYFCCCVSPTLPSSCFFKLYCYLLLPPHF